MLLMTWVSAPLTEFHLSGETTPRRSTPLGVLLPLMGANFVTVAIAGRVLFGEQITRRRAVGIALVAIGFVLVGIASDETH